VKLRLREKFKTQGFGTLEGIKGKKIEKTKCDQVFLQKMVSLRVK
jgi:hypothetical protein